MKRGIPLALALFTAAIAGCDDSPSDIQAPPPDDAFLASLMASAAGPPGTYPCPEGGRMTRQVQVEQSTGQDVVTILWEMSMQHDACAIRAGDIVLVTDGPLAVDGIERRRIDGTPGGRLIESTQHQTGNLHWHGDGYDRTCAIDLTITRDPETDVRHFFGTICGRPIDFEVKLDL